MRCQAEHLLNSLGRVVFTSTEDIGLGAALIANLVDLSLDTVNNHPHIRVEMNTPLYHM